MPNGWWPLICDTWHDFAPLRSGARGRLCAPRRYATASMFPCGLPPLERLPGVVKKNAMHSQKSGHPPSILSEHRNSSMSTIHRHDYYYFRVSHSKHNRWKRRKNDCLGYCRIFCWIYTSIFIKFVITKLSGCLQDLRHSLLSNFRRIGFYTHLKTTFLRIGAAAARWVKFSQFLTAHPIMIPCCTQHVHRQPRAGCREYYNYIAGAVVLTNIIDSACR